MDHLYIDVETFSGVDLKRAGVYPYVNSPDFEILILCYAWNDQPVKAVDFASGDRLPAAVREALLNPTVIKHAHNAAFERLCFSSVGLEIPADQWECSAVKAAYCGLPMGLEDAGKALALDAKKDAAGKALIRFFSIPIKPSKANNFKKRNLPNDDPEKWAAFVQYCKDDVEVERQIIKALSPYKIPKSEKALYSIDQNINDRGVFVDLDLVAGALSVDAVNSKKLKKQLTELTGLTNPNSPQQLKAWLSLQTNENITSLAKGEISELLEASESGPIREVLELRQKSAKTSVKKYASAEAVADVDGRARGLFQFYGAGRTGRWAGRLIQVQNLPRNYLDLLELAREQVKAKDIDGLNLIFSDIQNVLSQLTRTMFTAPAGKTLIVADFSAIEARVIAWLAGESWRLRVFETHGKIYEASAALMFGVPMDSIGKGSDLRQKGKIAELALGYQGGTGALIQMGGEGMGLSLAEMQTIVSKWRKANPNIKSFWADLEKAAVYAMENANRKVYLKNKLISFLYDSTNLIVGLPSGRALIYQKPGLREGNFGKQLYYYGMIQTIKQFGKIDTYGGKLAENIVQAVARDLLADTILRTEAAGHEIVMHVHDEIVVEAGEATAPAAYDSIINLMSISPDWAPGLPLKGDGFITQFYKKD